jgi:ATP-dependent helicase HrpB
LSLIPLPIDPHLAKITELVLKGSTTILSAAPGSGKTTRLPWPLTQALKGKVLVLEPRRVAAQAAAARIAEENHLELGNEVGYQVRFEKKWNHHTRLIFMTEATLQQHLIRDPQLSGVSLVILDEFHERSIHTDLALGLLRELQQLERTDLKILVMSATLNTESLKKFLPDAEVIDVPGQVQELQIQFAPHSQILHTRDEFFDRAQETLKRALSIPRAQRDLLFFLPGVGEIQKLKTILENSSLGSQLLIEVLHGQLNFEEQKKVLLPKKQRRLILATNVAESAITLDGVDTVIDSGLARVSDYDPNLDLVSLELKRISKASATQRAGRSARQFPGTTLRMWSQLEHSAFQDHEIAEIHRTELSQVMLLLAFLGIQDAVNFTWFDQPSKPALESALKYLKVIKALGPSGEITALGKRILQFPLPTRISHLLTIAETKKQFELGAILGTLLSEKDLGYPAGSEECDLSERIHHFEDLLRRKSLPFQHRKTYEQLKSLLTANESGEKKNLESNLNEILIPAFGDQLCRRRKPQERSLLRRDGYGLDLSPTSQVRTLDFLLPLKSALIQREARIDWARGLTPKEVLNYFGSEFQIKSRLIFDEKTMSLKYEEGQFLDALPIENPRQRKPTAEEVQDLLPQLVQEHWSLLLDRNEKAKSLFQRLGYYYKTDSFLSSEQTRELRENFCYGESSFQALLDKDMSYFIFQIMGSEEQNKVNHLCPESFKAPTGNHFKIHYSLSSDPYVEVRIQELFGLDTHPTVGPEKENLVFHLLAPNFRPTQITKDIVGFWKNSYFEVKKDLKARYPKHSWPDNPMEAKPEAKGRRQH